MERVVKLLTVPEATVIVTEPETLPAVNVVVATPATVVAVVLDRLP